MGRRVAVVHDYLTQRGGAERVVLSILRAFPGAPLYTALYLPERTFPSFGDADVRVLNLNQVPLMRRYHRLALPLLAPAFARLTVTADVVICSSSGWAHGARAIGRKVVYCHSPARWLYQPQRYLRGQGSLRRAALALVRRPLVRWDRHAAATGHRYLTNSTAVRERIRQLYGITAQVLPPPYTLDRDGPQRAIPGMHPGFFLCVSRLLPYKNADMVLRALADLQGERLVVVGKGPIEPQLRARAPANVRFAGAVTDEELRWLYSNCKALVSASYEDYGLTPVEAAAFGKPSVVLRWGGFLDTVIEGKTGIFFERPEAQQIREALEAITAKCFRGEELEAHAAGHSEAVFIDRLRAIVNEELSHTTSNPARSASPV